MPFLRFVAGRLAGAVLTVVGVSALTYSMLRLLYPEGFGVDGPLLPQLWDFLRAAFLRGDLGTVTEARLGFRPVRELVLESLGADVSLLAGAMTIALAAGVVGGMVAARSRDSTLDHGLGVVALLALCAPVYVVGLALILLFSPDVDPVVSIPVVATTAYKPLAQDPAQWLQSLLIPWCVTGAPLAALALRMTRAMVLDTGEQDFLRTARAKGLTPRRVAFRHALPTSIAPVVTLAGTYTPLLVGNVLLVEKVFGIPGMFKNVPTAIDVGDFPLLQGMIIVGALLVVVANFVADVVLAWLDPRTRSG